MSNGHGDAGAAAADLSAVAASVSVWLAQAEVGAHWFLLAGAVILLLLRLAAGVLQLMREWNARKGFRRRKDDSDMGDG